VFQAEACKKGDQVTALVTLLKFNSHLMAIFFKETKTEQHFNTLIRAALITKRGRNKAAVFVCWAC
jgi:hypothetical protein